MCDEFLQKFPRAPVWAVVQPRRTAVLRLSGPQGALDLLTAYFPAGDPSSLHPNSIADNQAAMGQVLASLQRQREALRSAIAAWVSNAADALTVVAGDFNWVAATGDRISKTDGSSTGSRDGTEESHWTRFMAWIP